MIDAFYIAFVEEIDKIAQQSMRQMIPGQIGARAKIGPASGMVKLKKPKVEKHPRLEQQARLTGAKTLTPPTLKVPAIPPSTPKQERAETSPTMDYAQMMLMQQAMTPQPGTKRPWGTPRPKVHEGI